MTSQGNYSIPLPLAIVLLLAGVLLAITDTWASWEFMKAAEGGRITSLVVAVPVAAVAALLALPGARIASQIGHRFEAVALILVLIAASAFSLSTTLERNGQARSDQVAERETANIPYQLAKDRRDKAQADLSAAETAMAAERKGSDAWKREKAKADAARQRLKEAEGDMAKAGAPKTTDHLAATVMLIFPTLPEAWVRKVTGIVQSMLLPVVLHFGSLAFASVGFGALMRRMQKPQEAPRAGQEAMPATVPAAAPINVFEFPKLSRKDERQWQRAVARLTALRA